MPNDIDFADQSDTFAQSPLHGDQGDRAIPPQKPRIPSGLTVALSREAGARGGTIAASVGEMLGWQVYTQELLEYSMQDDQARQGIFDGLPEGAAEWIEEQVRKSPIATNRSRHPLALDLVRMVLALGVQGEVVIIGRGAGHILPRRTTLHVRLVSPIGQRVAYMSQWLRLTEEEAAAQVELRDARRDEFIRSHFDRSPMDVHQYDMVLNTSSIGADTAAALIAEAAKAKMERM